jgi:CRISPR/Cas system CSM-associated protein Csm3 (group 7 of RAMP superfamily)
MVIRFRLRLKAVSLLTVGQGVPEVFGADIVQARKRRVGRQGAEEGSVCYVPGSSFKGAWRTATSRIAAAYGFISCGEVEPGRIVDAHSRLGRVCDVCRAFGYPGGPESSSQVVVGDFEVQRGTGTVIVARVSLDDGTLTAREGALYSVEHLPPGTELLGEVRVRRGAEGLLPLLLLGLAELRTSSFGRRSLVDIKLEDEGVLTPLIEARWLPLLEGLRSWLWEGVVNL